MTTALDEEDESSRDLLRAGSLFFGGDESAASFSLWADSRGLGAEMIEDTETWVTFDLEEEESSRDFLRAGFRLGVNTGS